LNLAYLGRLFDILSIVPYYGLFAQYFANIHFMALKSHEQVVELVSRASHILVVTREHPTVDSACAAIATGLLLEKLGKSCDVVIPGWQEADRPKFLSEKPLVHDTLGAIRTFHLTLDVSRVPLSELMYDVKDGKLDITVIPKHSEWTPKDFTFRHGDDRYDLVIALDIPDMASLGEAFRSKADFFYRTSVINIDHHSTNEYWGQVNLVDLNAVSATEALYTFVKDWNDMHLTPDIATAILAGMISKTRSFRTANVTPRTLAVSSELIERGARRGEIVTSLWRNRSVATLKLWGRALARLEQDRDIGLVWTSLTEGDFLEAGAKPADIEGIVDELVAYAPEAKVVAIFMQERDGIRVHVYATPPLSAAELLRPFGGTGTRDRAVFISKEGTDLTKTAQNFLERLRAMSPKDPV